MKFRSQTCSLITIAFGAILFLSANAGFVRADESGAGSKPNIVFILTDDLGYSDISCYGATKVKTPHIDQLAAGGIRFTDFHSAASICSPSRAAFLTGGYPQRAGLYMGINPVRKAHWFLGLNPDEITIAEQLKGAGYNTFMVGKWHLGTEPEFLPRRQGFDHYYGMPCNFDHSPKFFDNDKQVFARTPLDRLTHLYTQRVTKIIRENSKQKSPFFLYYAHNYPHTPFKASKKFLGSSKDGVRGDVIQELDASIGAVMQALKQAGVSENTIVIFTSDNGPTKNVYAKPFRGTKYVTFEGGHRVPFIFHWPARFKSGQVESGKVKAGRVKPGSVSNLSINAMDLFPTLSKVAGVPLPPDRIYDGESLLPLLDGQPLKRNEAEPFYYYNCENLQAVRVGNWKLHLPRKSEQVPFWDKNQLFRNLNQPVLYDLLSDEGEYENVAKANPKIVNKLLQLANVKRKELGEFMHRGSGQRKTGSVYPNAPVVSHEKDWGQVPMSVVETLIKERKKRHPGWTPKSRRKKVPKKANKPVKKK
jgi:arylsulfatase A-like enzyme